MKPTLDEPTFYEKLLERPPARVYQCPQCKKAYFSISYHLLYKCSGEKAPHLAPVVQKTPENEVQSGSPDGLVLIVSPESSPLAQDETPIKDPPEVMPGVYRKDSHDSPNPQHQRRRLLSHTATGGDRLVERTVPPSSISKRGPGEDLLPDQACSYGASPEPTRSPQEEDGEVGKPAAVQVGKSIPEKREPHWWQWCQKISHEKCCGQRSSSIVPYTPHPVVRRRSVPSIACALYYSAWALYATKQSADNALPGYVKTSEAAFKADNSKVENLINLLVFCEVPRELARGLAIEAYRDAEEGLYKHWSDSPKGKGIGRGMLALIGYQLAEGEPNGGGNLVS